MAYLRSAVVRPLAEISNLINSTAGRGTGTPMLRLLRLIWGLGPRLRVRQPATVARCMARDEAKRRRSRFLTGRAPGPGPPFRAPGLPLALPETLPVRPRCPIMLPVAGDLALRRRPLPAAAGSRDGRRSLRGEFPGRGGPRAHQGAVKMAHSLPLAPHSSRRQSLPVAPGRSGFRAHCAARCDCRVLKGPGASYTGYL